MPKKIEPTAAVAVPAAPPAHLAALAAPQVFVEDVRAYFRRCGDRSSRRAS
ncbi:MAG: hypothetical protein ACR2F6_15335 [Mycobacteriales bacterium]